ncbi:MAG: amidase family protein [Anaerolineales bacterium]
MKLKPLPFLLLIALLFAGCQTSTIGDVEEGACPLLDLPFPHPEPDYTGKLERDFTPFARALEEYTPELVAAREELVSGKTIPELQALMETGDLTSVELTIYYLERIQRYDVDKLNSVLELNPEVLDIAQVLDDERAAGDLRGPMHGIPVLLKDNIATGDQLHTAAGAAVMLDWDPERDAFLVNQLREAGTIILGKTNLSEWANWMDSCMPNGFSANGGQTRNPYGPFETFGSSSGSAVSVAADLSTASIGTETQGSLIKPAGINSVVALKTSRGLVSRDYIIPLLPAQDVPGPLGRTVTDVTVLLSAMTGVDDNDPETVNTAELAGTDFTQFLNAAAISDLRVGLPVWNDAAFEAYFTQLGIDDANAQAETRKSYQAQIDAQRAIAETLKQAGVTIVEIPYTELPKSLDFVTVTTHGYKVAINQFLNDLGENAPVTSLEAIISFNAEDRANRAPYGQDHLEASQNSDRTAEEFETMVQENQQTARDRIDSLFEQYDIDLIASDMNQLYAPAGYPALTVPAGYAQDGTPQDVVFVGGFLSEPDLLAVGYAFEQSAAARVAPDLETTTMNLIAALGEE